MIHLNRHHVFTVVVVLVFSVLLVKKLNFIQNAGFAQGRLIGIKEVKTTRGIDFIPQIIYSVNGKSYEFAGTENTVYTAEWLPIIFDKKNPQKAYVYDFMGFWFFGLLMCLFICLLSGAFIYGFMEKKTRINIKLFTRK